jgi:hypothetical protein
MEFLPKELLEALAKDNVIRAFRGQLDKLKIRKSKRPKSTNKRKPKSNRQKDMRIRKRKDGKSYSRPKPKPQAPSKSTPKVPDPKTAKTKLGRIRDKVKGKAKQAKKVIKKGAEKAKQYVKTKRTFYRVRPDPTDAKQVGFDKKKPTQTPNRTAKTTRAMKGTKAIQKGLKIGKGVGKLAKIGKGLRTLGIGYAADLAAGEVVDRTFRAISGKNKMTLKEFRAERDRKLKSIGKKNKLKTWKNPARVPDKPEIKSDDKKTTSNKDIKAKTKKNLVQTPSPKWGVKKTEAPKKEKKKKDSPKTTRINKSSKAARFARRDLRVKRITSNYLKDKKRKR